MYFCDFCVLLSLSLWILFKMTKEGPLTGGVHL